MGEWIAIKDERPPINKKVLLTGGLIHEIGALLEKDGELILWIHNCGFMDIEAYTHWMPLPELPKEENK